MTLSARAITICGMGSPICLAVFRLIADSSSLRLSSHEDRRRHGPQGIRRGADDVYR
jgi:hypothetical protein